MKRFFLLFSLLWVLSGSTAGTQTPTPTPVTEFVLVGAGDIARCDSKGDEATAALIDAIPGTVFTAGDNAYPAGTADDFQHCYEPSWGRFKARTRPSAGNHDFQTKQGRDYQAYFGEGFGKAGANYYSYDLGAWHIVVIDSNIRMDANSAQAKWLLGDLKAHPATCLLAIWHHPLFTSGNRGGNPNVYPMWKILYDHGAEIIINGHDHHYERFAPQTPDGRADPQRGIRQFIVGTGGSVLYAKGTPQPNSETFSNTTFGVLKLTLRPTEYRWEFIPTQINGYTDGGEGVCQ